MVDLIRETQRADLKRKLKNAKARLSRAEADVDSLEDELSWLDEQDALDLIRSWRGVPDWSVLLEAERGMSLYKLMDFMLDRLGFRSSGMWGDTKQVTLHFGIAAKDDPTEAAAYVARIRRTIEQIAPFVLPHGDGLLWFGINGADTDNCALELRMSPDLKSVKIVRLHYGEIDEEQVFSGLGEALFHLQDKHPSDDAFEWHQDPADAPGGTGEYLRLALSAFFDGCRSAGIPIEHAGFGALTNSASDAA